MKFRCPQCRQEIYPQRAPFRFHMQISHYIETKLKKRLENQSFLMLQHIQTQLQKLSQIKQKLIRLQEKSEKPNNMCEEFPEIKQLIILFQGQQKTLSMNLDKLQHQLPRKSFQFHHFTLEDTEDAIKHMKQSLLLLQPIDKERFMGFGNKEGIRYCVDTLRVDQAFEKLLPLCLESVSMYDMLSFWCAYSEKQTQHLKWYKQVVLMHPKNPYFMFGLANIMFNTNHFEQARQLYFECSQLLPQDKGAIALQKIAFCYHYEDKKQEKLEILSKIQRKSREAICHMVMDQKQQTQYVLQVRRIIELEPKYGLGWLALALHFNGGKIQYLPKESWSVRCLEQGISHAPDTIGLHCFLKKITQDELQRVNLCQTIISQKAVQFDTNKKAALRDLCAYYADKDLQFYQMYKEKSRKMGVGAYHQTALYLYHCRLHQEARKLWQLHKQQMSATVDEFYHYYARNQMADKQYQTAAPLFVHDIQVNKCKTCYQPAIECYQRLGQLDKAKDLATEWLDKTGSVKAEKTLNKLQKKSQWIKEVIE